MFVEKAKLSTQFRNSLRFRTRKRYPTKLQWQMLKKLQNNTMEPETFVERWELTQKELAQICFCSLPTVQRWFLFTENKRAASPYHKFWLGLTNKLWTDLLIQDKH